MIQLNFENHTGVPIDASLFRNTLDAAWKKREIQSKFAGRAGEGSITLTLTGDTEITELNKKYRNKNTPTDVLSFGYVKDWDVGHAPKRDVGHAPKRTAAASDTKQASVSPDMIGEIVISLDTAKCRAGEYGHSLETELKKLFIHGFLHTMGYNHETDEEEAAMERIASTVLGRKKNKPGDMLKNNAFAPKKPLKNSQASENCKLQ